MALEATAQARYVELMPGRYFKVSNYCRADGVFRIGNDVYLGVQVKTASESGDTPGTFKFSGTDGYEGMVLLCRPAGAASSLVMPGSMVRSKSIRYAPFGKHARFLVGDADLPGLMARLAAAAVGSTVVGSTVVGSTVVGSTVTWPSGATLDVGDCALELGDRAHFSVPVHDLHRREVRYQALRKRLFPHARFVSPSRDDTPVDVWMNGARVQDKVASPVGADGRFRVSLHKVRSGARVPYDDVDFDVLWVFFPDGSRRSLVIPMDALVDRGIVRRAHAPSGTGTTTMTFDACDAGHWTRTHVYDMSARGDRARVLRVIERRG